ncbi:MAG: peptide ABC transporter substrate-binding protein, partial [Chlamydiia bacterium]|nr:peptide ABC transporter substrate-binding protein [Chlamydiia bacterium]
QPPIQEIGEDSRGGLKTEMLAKGKTKSWKMIGIILIAAFVVGCHKKSSVDSQRKVRLSILAPVRSLDPRISNEYPSVHVMNMLYEGLMRLGPDGEILFGAAESVTLSKDQCIYTFHLKDSCWSNGDPVTAYDYEYAWKKSVDPLTAKTGAFTFYTIKNVAACLEGSATIDEVGIRALDAKTLEVELEHPAPYFLSLCACSTYSPIHKKFDQFDPNWANSVNDHFVSNGPFKLVSWKKSVEIILEKNPYYWGASEVKLPGIAIQIVPDANTQFLLFEKGELDWIGEPFNVLPIDIIMEHKEDPRLRVIDSYGLYWFFVNVKVPPFNNKNFRKALAYALNRKEIAEHVFQLGEEPAMGILSEGLAVHDAPYFPDGDLSLAKKIFDLALEELGMSPEEVPTLVLSQRSCLFTSRVNQAVQEQLRKGLGLNVEIDQVDWPVHFNRMSKGDFQFGEMGWTSWLRDPIYMLDTFRTANLAINMSNWEDAKYQELLVKSDHEIDPVKRKRYLQKAEALLMEEMPVIPLCYNKLKLFQNPSLKGVYMSPLKEIDFRYAYFDESSGDGKPQ